MSISSFGSFFVIAHVFKYEIASSIKSNERSYPLSFINIFFISTLWSKHLNFSRSAARTLSFVDSNVFIVSLFFVMSLSFTMSLRIFLTHSKLQYVAAVYKALWLHVTSRPHVLLIFAGYFLHMAYNLTQSCMKAYVMTLYNPPTTKTTQKRVR